jgi:hypothetical protein
MLPKERSLQEQTRKKHNPGVQEKIARMYEKNAKPTTFEHTEARRAAKRQKRIDTREEALLSPAPVGVMTTMQKLRLESMTRN